MINSYSYLKERQWYSAGKKGQGDEYSLLHEVV